MVEIWVSILIAVLALLAGVACGYFLARFLFKRYLKKNPPVNEKMVRAMMTQMGRTPSEKQVRQVMKSMDEAK